ncbi:Galactokinase [Hondaea fermentalgiana]|uniref:Galactokinase n=1 Tax=Hondaea fermentalgiana TaxID=2315210 RepID=A0A2R5GNF0_9STRA|nr:Galactokinase [Hondaea fermentalgiana]|eukprot:GBG32416.1 Galactokinase [Hondaea fermentalgiana]
MGDDVEAQARKLFATAFEGADKDAAAPGKEKLEKAVCVVAPGRVNLIGEHTDYNDGFVMPLALKLATVCVARRREDGGNSCRIVSALDPSSMCEFTLDETSDSLVAGKDTSWAKYVKGVIKGYMKELSAAAGSSDGTAVGFDAAFASDVPIGAGLSSSASLEVCTAIMLEQVFGVDSVSPIDRALRCVEAEHTFAMMPCGIMDQYISSCGVKGCALLIDCRSREPTEVNLDDPDLVIVVANSNVKHELTGSEYPDRVKSCKAAVAAVDEEFKSDGKSRTALRDVSIEELQAVKDKGAIDEVTYKRAFHGVSEDKRTLEAVKAAQAADYVTVGKLMVQSHESLRDNYEVSVPEIDFLVDHCLKQEGVFGSRITGGGFGGCTVSLVKSDKAEAVMTELGRAFNEKYGKDCACFATKLEAGARLLWNNNEA